MVAACSRHTSPGWDLGFAGCGRGWQNRSGVFPWSLQCRAPCPDTSAGLAKQEMPREPDGCGNAGVWPRACAGGSGPWQILGGSQDPIWIRPPPIPQQMSNLKFQEVSPNLGKSCRISPNVSGIMHFVSWQWLGVTAVDAGAAGATGGCLALHGQGAGRSCVLMG